MSLNDFKWKYFAPSITFWCIRNDDSISQSYTDVSDILAERGVFSSFSHLSLFYQRYSDRRCQRYQVNLTQ